MKRKQTEITNDIKTRALKTIRLLEKEHSDAEIALTFKNPRELLISTILSAQCTDKRVSIVTKTLFKKYKTLEDYAKADIKELEQDIRSTGFYHNKARHIKKCCQMLIEKFGSQVPRTMEELLELPGVARKTANIVLSNGFGIVEGIAVDTHVRRLSERLGLTQNKNQHKIEQDLMKVVSKEMWMRFSDFLVFHGRRICMAKKPKCGECVLNKICPSAFTFS